MTAIKADILIVDDTPENLKILTAILKKEAYQVRPALNATLALNAIQKSKPDLILLDINMPEIDGYELCTRLKADSSTRDIPVIFISALSEMPDKVKAFQVGGVDYMIKPFQAEEILARIHNQLTISQLRHHLEQRVAELERLYSRIQDDLNTAHDIQMGLLPPTTRQWSDADIVCYSQPAREVGGDFYAYHRMREGCVVLAVGDVSGKGMAAALLMAITLAMFESALTYAMPPSHLLTYLDRKLAHYTQSSRQNCALCYVDIEANTLRFANAGGIPPYLWRTNGTVESPEIGGFALGQNLGSMMGYQEHHMELAPLDMVILTTDGVIEANNHAKELLGFDRFEAMIGSYHTQTTAPNHTPQSMLEHLKKALFAFIGDAEQHDDMTIMVVQIPKKPNR